MKECKHQHCAVCTNLKYREVFEQIEASKNVDWYSCPYVAYIVKNTAGNEIPIFSLEHLKKGTKGYFVKDFLTGEPVYLQKDNFTIICKAEDECIITEPTVREYFL